jgi:formate dehydrogenase subunit gamma
MTTEKRPLKRKRKLVLALMAVSMVAVGLLSWGLAEPADAKPGYSCNPAPGHGDPGCHRTTATTKRTTTTKRATTTTKRATTTTKAPTTTTKATAVNSTTTATTGLGLTATTASASTTVSEDSTTSVTDPSTTLDPTAGDTAASDEESTTSTDLSELVAAIVASGIGGGGGPTGGWIALLLVLAILAGAGWALLAAKWARSRRDSAARSAGSGPLRFVLAERLGHWVYALCFLAAGVTGALMWIPSTAQWMAEAYFAVARFHGYVGLAMVLTPFLIFLILDRRRIAENRRALGGLDANDRRWLRAALAGGMFRAKRMPPQGRFNAGQKINSYLVAGLTLAFLVTGSLLIAREHLPEWLASGVLLSHKVLAVAGATLLVGHVGMALLTPHGRGGLKAMVKGILPAHIAREGHSLWYAEWLRHRHQEDVGPAAADNAGAGRAVPVTPPSA